VGDTDKKLSVPPTGPGSFSFDEVYDEHFDYVYRIVSRLSAGRDVDDLVQDVFVVVHRKVGDFDGQAPITSWLFKIAYRVVRAHQRKQRVRGALFSLFEKEVDREEAPRQLQLVEHAKRTETTLAALHRLSFKKRAVLLLHSVEGWSCEEIAEELAVPLGTVHTRLHHARRDMRAMVEKAEGR
jgi:RNA polymerase sigma-70 factor (ECF subfamily)